VQGVEKGLMVMTRAAVLRFAPDENDRRRRLPCFGSRLAIRSLLRPESGGALFTAPERGGNRRHVRGVRRGPRARCPRRSAFANMADADAKARLVAKGNPQSRNEPTSGSFRNSAKCQKRTCSTRRRVIVGFVVGLTRNQLKCSEFGTRSR
jgi:hypothetical protein